MKIMRLSDSGQEPALVEVDAPRPEPGPTELLIRVCAAGVTRTELSWHPTLYRKTGERRSGAVPGHEFSGVVVDAGEEVGRLEIGREVYGMNDWFCEGAMAEYCVSPFYAVAPKPGNLTHIEAASIPIGALTAWQGLFDHAKLQPGERLLIHGGAGAVGVFAIQLAKLKGAHVIATAASHNVDFVTSLGADTVIDYGRSPFDQRVRGVDIVLDTVGGETLERSWGVLKPGGRMVTVVSSAEGSEDPRVKKAFFIVEPNQKQLTEIGNLLDERRIRPVVDTVVPLSRASDAFVGHLERRGRGKLAVVVAA